MDRKWDVRQQTEGSRKSVVLMQRDRESGAFVDVAVFGDAAIAARVSAMLEQADAPNG